MTLGREAGREAARAAFSAGVSAEEAVGITAVAAPAELRPAAARVPTQGLGRGTTNGRRFRRRWVHVRGRDGAGGEGRRCPPGGLNNDVSEDEEWMLPERKLRGGYPRGERGKSVLGKALTDTV